MNINDALKSLKDWVKQGRELKANHIIIVYDKINKKHFPHFIFNDDIDSAWNSFNRTKEDPMISFNLNKKVLGVDNAS